MRKKDELEIAGKFFNSRLLLGTGKYKSSDIALKSIDESQAEIITVAVRRTNLKNFHVGIENLLSINWDKKWFLPNTAGSKNADEAIRTAFLGRELAQKLGQPTNNFVKLEVISDPKYLLPDPLGTLKAAKFLVNNDFTVLPYMSSDPILARHLEDIGCAALMPLGSPIGSGQGLLNTQNIEIILENTVLPVIIDAGIGKPSDACKAMELGASAVLLNSAVANSQDSILMAKGMRKAVEAGREAYLSGIMKKTNFAKASSPTKNIID